MPAVGEGGRAELMLVPMAMVMSVVDGDGDGAATAHREQGGSLE